MHLARIKSALALGRYIAWCRSGSRDTTLTGSLICWKAWGKLTRKSLISRSRRSEWPSRNSYSKTWRNTGRPSFTKTVFCQTPWLRRRYSAIQSLLKSETSWLGWSRVSHYSTSQKIWLIRTVNCKSKTKSRFMMKWRLRKVQWTFWINLLKIE